MREGGCGNDTEAESALANIQTVLVIDRSGQLCTCMPIRQKGISLQVRNGILLEALNPTGTQYNVVPD